MRTKSRISAVAVAAMLAFGLSSCSEDAPPPEATPSPSETATNDPSDDPTTKPVKNPTEKPEGGESVICRDKKTLTPFTGTAVAKFGADEVMDAYCEMADFFYLNAVTNLTPPRDSYDAIELSWVKDWMTPDAAADWDSIVKKELADLTDGDAQISRITYFNLRGLEELGYTFPEQDSGLPSMIGGGVGTANAALSSLDDGADALDVQFTVTTNVVVQKGNKDLVIPIERNVSLRLAPSGSKANDAHSWLIAGWRTNYQSELAKPLSEFTATKQ